MSPVPLGVAVVGAGRIGALHARHLAGSVEGARLVLVVDALEGVAQRSAYAGAVATTAFESALEHPGVDALVLASPTSLHAEQLERGAAAGKAIFCEKPIAETLDATVRAMQLVEAAGVPFQVGFNRRFDPAYGALARSVHGGEIGRVELFRSQSTDPAPPPESYVAVSGGFLRDSVIHDLDTARFVAGEVERVTALGRVLVDPMFGRHGDVDTCVVTLEFASGALGVVMNSRRTSYGHDLRVEVHGAEGKLVAEDERATKLWRYGHGGMRGDYFGSFLERFREAYRLELQAFVDAVRGGAPPSPGARDAVESLRLAEAATRSLRENRPVHLAESVGLGARDANSSTGAGGSAAGGRA